MKTFISQKTIINNFCYTNRCINNIFNDQLKETLIIITNTNIIIALFTTI